MTAEPNLGYAFEDWSVSGSSLSSSASTNPNTLYLPCPGSVSLTANYLAPATLNLWNWTGDSFDTVSNLPSLSSFSSDASASESSIQSNTYLSYSPCFNNLTLSTGVANNTAPAYEIFYNSYCYWYNNVTYSGNVTVDISMIQDSNTGHWVSTMWANFFLPNGEHVNAGDLLNQSGTYDLSYLLDHPEINGVGGGLIEELATVGQQYESSSNSTLNTQGSEYVSLSNALTDFENTVSLHSDVLGTIVEGYTAIVNDFSPNIMCSTIFTGQIVGLVMFPGEAAEMIGAETMSELSARLGSMVLKHYAEEFGAGYFGCTPLF